MRLLTALAAPPALGTIALLGLAGCKLPTLNVGTSDPIDVDIKMRVDIYQHSGEAPPDPTQEREYAAVVESQRDRMEEIQNLKNSRWVGENHLGLLEIRQMPAGEDGAYVKETVAAENKDRTYLMRAEAKRRESLLTEIQDELWKQRVKNAFQGEWVQIRDRDDPSGFRWVQKKTNTEIL
ncbi:hypothetical protein BH23VER1_BH23VER1_10780 [soil metagenome]